MTWFDAFYNARWVDTAEKGGSYVAVPLPRRTKDAARWRRLLNATRRSHYTSRTQPLPHLLTAGAAPSYGNDDDLDATTTRLSCRRVYGHLHLMFLLPGRQNGAERSASPFLAVTCKPACALCIKTGKSQHLASRASWHYWHFQPAGTPVRQTSYSVL